MGFQLFKKFFGFKTQKTIYVIAKSSNDFPYFGKKSFIVEIDYNGEQLESIFNKEHNFSLNPVAAGR